MEPKQIINASPSIEVHLNHLPVDTSEQQDRRQKTAIRIMFENITERLGRPTIREQEIETLLDAYVMTRDDAKEMFGTHPPKIYDSIINKKLEKVGLTKYRV